MLCWAQQKNYLQIQPWCGVLFLFLCSCHNTIFQKYLSPKLIFCFYLIWGCSCNQDRCLKTIIDYKPPFYKELIRGVLNNTEHLISIPTEFEAIFFNYFSSCFELFLCGFSQALQPSRIFELKVNRFMESSCHTEINEEIEWALKFSSQHTIFLYLNLSLYIVIDVCYIEVA